MIALFSARAAVALCSRLSVGMTAKQIRSPALGRAWEVDFLFGRTGSLIWLVLGVILASLGSSLSFLMQI
jgi:hypothetical protein